MHPTPKPRITAWIMSPTTTEAHDEEWFQENDAGSGPYIIDSRERGARVILKAFKDYWGGWQSGQFTQAVIEVIDDTVVRQQMIASGDADRSTNLLKMAPHTAELLTADLWDRPYSRHRAAFPDEHTRHHKFWPAVGRVDNVYGDRNVVCECPPMEAYAEV